MRVCVCACVRACVRACVCVCVCVRARALARACMQKWFGDSAIVHVRVTVVLISANAPFVYPEYSVLLVTIHPIHSAWPRVLGYIYRGLTYRERFYRGNGCPVTSAVSIIVFVYY